MVLRGDLHERLVELQHVVSTVVGRESDAGQNHFAAPLKQRADDGVQVATRVCNGNPAKPIIAAKFDNGNRWMERENVPEAVNAVFCRVAADSGIDDAVMVAASVEFRLQNGGIRMPWVESVSGRNAVAKAVDDGNGSARRGVTIRKQQKCGGNNAAVHSKRIAIQRG